jgi:uncharacterized membrane protein YfcA
MDAEMYQLVQQQSIGDALPAMVGFSGTIVSMHFSYEFALLSLAAWLVGLSKGGLPTIGMLAVPILSLMMPPMQAAVLLLPIYILSDMVGIYLYRKAFSAVHLRILIPAGLVGIGIGWGTASWVSDAALALLIGMIGIGFCLNSWLRTTGPTITAEPHKGWGRFWGALSGFTSFISHAGGPPFQVYMLPQKLPKLVFAGTSTLFFAVVNAAKLVPYQFIRPYSSESLHQAAWLVPAALLGTVMGAWLTKRLADAWFFRLVQIGLFIVSLKLVWSALPALF